MTALSAAAMATLRGAVADERTVRLAVVPDRATYVEIERALTRMGGRWDSRERAYLFTRDPRPRLKEMTGRRPLLPASASRDLELSYWPTPPALAAELVEGLDVPEGVTVLEPSAGDGALVAALRARHRLVQVCAVEIDSVRTQVLSRRFADDELVQVVCAPFQDWAAANPSPGWAAAVMNPPFTEPGDRYAWATHLQLAWSLLRPGGQLRAIVPASFEFGRQRPIVAARSLIQQAGGSARRAPDGAFRASGTLVHTLLVQAARPTCDHAGSSGRATEWRASS